MEWMLMPLKRYAEFGGRSRRMEFWMFQLLLVVLGVGAFVALMVIGLGAIGMASGGNATTGLAGMFASLGILAVVFLVAGLALFIPSLAVQVRRLHDTNRSGWWLMIYFGPYMISMLVNVAGANQNSMTMVGAGGVLSLLSLIGWVTLIVFYCLPGTNGPNDYGPDPLGGTAGLAETFQ
ncbi:MAG: DUF805 domain-containing protein [Sphingomonas sp.]